MWEIPVQYVAIIVAAYSGLIVYYIGSIVNEQLQSGTEAETNRLRIEVNRLRIENECRRIEAEKKNCLRRIAESKTEATKSVHEKKLQELETEYDNLMNDKNGYETNE